MTTYAIIGLGYVGLGLATALAKENQVWGYDINQDRIRELQQQSDRNQLIDRKDLTHSTLVYTDKLNDIKDAQFYIVAVATPALFYILPDLEPLIAASKALATILKKNDIVVFESTVYPGTTEDVCIPILEQYSHLKCGEDFQVGYSPERINPCDEKHTLYNIPKIISAQNPETLQRVKETYEMICQTVYPVSNIATAEAIKILENTQRDVNIALMNEFTQIMHALNLDTHEIIEGAKTKWSFIPFKPGLVGGHCISIDPLYLAFQAKRHSVPSDLILTARKINDGITSFIVQSMVKLFISHKINLENITVGLFGIAYKENTVDVRNSLSLKLIKELSEYGFKCRVHDPLQKSLNQYGNTVILEDFDDIDELSIAVILVAHDFYQEMGLENIVKKCKNPTIVMDIPNLFSAQRQSIEHCIYWSL